MKSCPTCNQTYADDSLNYCLADGSVLSAPYDPSASHLGPAPPARNLPKTEVLYHAPKSADQISPSANSTLPSLLTPTPRPKAEQSRAPEKQNNKRRVIIVGAIFVGMLFGLAMAVGWNRWMAKQAGADPMVSNSNTVNSNMVSNSNTVNANTANTRLQTLPSPGGTPSQTDKLNVTGTWKGKFDGANATLIIENQEGDSFTGTLGMHETLIAIAGRIDQDTRQVTINETRVLKQNLKKYTPWKLGKDVGSISSDGKSMKGKGKDATHSYSWAFSKK